MILGKCALMHASSLHKWLAQKQMKFEGGFQVSQFILREPGDVVGT